MHVVAASKACFSSSSTFSSPAFQSHINDCLYPRSTSRTTSTHPPHALSPSPLLHMDLVEALQLPSYPLAVRCHSSNLHQIYQITYTNVCNVMGLAIPSRAILYLMLQVSAASQPVGSPTSAASSYLGRLVSSPQDQASASCWPLNVNIYVKH